MAINGYRCPPQSVEVPREETTKNLRTVAIEPAIGPYENARWKIPHEIAIIRIMSRTYLVKLNLACVAANLANLRGWVFSMERAGDWLEEQGFQRQGDDWIADARLIGELRHREVVEVQPIDSTPPEPGDLPLELPTHPYYNLGPARRRKLALIPGYDQCIIPKFLCGKPGDVLQKCRRIARNALKKGSWKPALANEEFIHIDDAPGLLLMTSQRSAFTDEDNVLLNHLTEVLSDIAFDMFEKPDCYRILRDLRIEGTADFWFSLCMIVGNTRWLPVMPDCYEEDIRAAARKCFPNLMKWWPHFCARDDRFAYWGLSGWPSWGLPGEFPRLFNWPVDWEYYRSVDATTAGKRLMELWEMDRPRRK